MKILFVEDEELLLSLFRKALEEQGYDVDIAKNGFEAQDILKNGPVYDFLVTDYSMPGMTGLELILKSRNYCPLMSCIIATGNTHELANELDKHQVNVDILPKPYKKNDLLALLEKKDERRTNFIK